MKIVAAKHFGRYGQQFKPGDALNVSARDALMYVTSGQATYAGQAAPSKPAPSKPAPRRPAPPPPEPAPPAPSEPEEEADDEAERKRKGRYRRRDMKAEGDGD